MRRFALLREAVRRDDALHYDELWGWMQPDLFSVACVVQGAQRFRLSSGWLR